MTLPSQPGGGSTVHGAALAAADWAGMRCRDRTIGGGVPGQPEGGRGSAQPDAGLNRRQPDAERDRHRPEIVELGSVPGFIVFDLPGAPVSAGGTRLAPDVTVAETALLARAMTYKFAVLGAQVGGAKAGLVGDPADRAATAAHITRYCEPIPALTDTGRFLTGPDMGTFEEDFA